MPFKTHSPRTCSVGLLALGCPRNLVDSEVALGGLVAAGYRYEPDVRRADVAIINTCGFIRDAKEESIQGILELAELKKRGQIKKLVIIGCLAQRYKDELFREFSEADAVLGVSEFAHLADVIPRLLKTGSQRVLRAPARSVYLKSALSPTQPLTPPYLRYVKIAEGCLSRCSYCAIPAIKGRLQSRAPEDILKEIRQAVSCAKVKEVVLIAQDTAAYGRDLGRGIDLGGLLTRIARITPEVWIRTLYLHPGHVTDSVIQAMEQHRNLCRYVDLPVEHSHPSVLERMGRRGLSQTQDNLIHEFRRRIPDLAIRSTVMTGFPGESREEFAHLCAFVRRIRFDRLGVFAYSREEGTRSAKMTQQIPSRTARSRRRLIMKAQEQISMEAGRRKIGSRLKVLIEGRATPGVYLGRSEHDAPEVDGEVIVRSRKSLPIGEFCRVRITGATEHDLEGVVG
ncbi:MAG: 30S ribosomal protein S12 methylthiotransferase RimO [Candidatus Omnitrophica bacterium]|nr:30S ribosomal protein S12 methylthiotransferase RimO [Candidatus Omnitrophota bacterium]